MNLTHKRHIQTAGESTEEMTPPMWCEFCRSHSDIGHYDGIGMHKAGPQFGPYGRLLWIELAVERVLSWYRDQEQVRHVCLDDLVEVYYNGKRTRDNGN